MGTLCSDAAATHMKSRPTAPKTECIGSLLGSDGKLMHQVQQAGRPEARIEVPQGIEKGNAVSIFLRPCNNNRDMAFGGTKPGQNRAG